MIAGPAKVPEKLRDTHEISYQAYKQQQQNNTCSNNNNNIIINSIYNNDQA